MNSPPSLPPFPLFFSWTAPLAMTGINYRGGRVRAEWDGFLGDRDKHLGRVTLNGATRGGNG